MSLTQVYTETTDGRNASTRSIALRARSPHPPLSPQPSRGSFDKGGDLELAQLGPTKGAPSASASISGGDTPTAEPVEAAKISKWTGHIQFLSLCFTLFVAGWNDGTTGPLLPVMQSHYHVNYTIVSLIFVFNCVGFVSGAAANVHLTDKLGFGKVMVLGSAFQVAGYAIDAAAPPFPAFVFAFALNGFGIALQDAGANGYVASLKDNAQTKMGLLHATYGAGALCAPLAATPISHMKHWSYQYLASVGIATLNTIVLAVVFRGKRQEECLEEIGQARTHTAVANLEDNKYGQIFRLREVHLLAFFILIYVGVEVTLGGWTVTYIVNERGGGRSAGFVSAGFFGGLTFGRVALLWVNKMIGERLAIYVYTVLAIGLELIVWLVPSLVGNAIAIAFIGALLGPIYPIVMNHSARILPHWLLTGAIGWIAGFGQAGSAFIPFITGVIASREGIWALQPLMVGMMAFMLILWFLVPGHARRVD
ncbi:MFS general substrate transporter [Phanerochaete sordida]|uniref:MFS general substrate transporter n=1 Tax=Phanerochaete sordida TaxID=48140 RepID=A0A9P3GIA7_9APHY|nr:MFS general substrate transporter [Phanerochaete sordida]